MTFLDFYRSRVGRRVLLYHAMALAAGVIALILGLGDGHVDVSIARWFFDDARRAFPLSNQWLLKTIMHDMARTTSVIVAFALMGLTATSCIARQLRALRAHRDALLFVSIAMLAAVATVGALKHFSSHACPWSLVIFGGSATYHPLLGARAAATEALAGCFPAAHPLTGYAWLAVGFALYPTARRRAWQAWAVAFGLGTLFGGVQIVRGAHFLSHVLWSAWVVWGVNLALLALDSYWPALRRHAPATSRADPAEPGSARRAASYLCRLP
jgi:membrane-associated PAP2 superfamily phosphatase